MTARRPIAPLQPLPRIPSDKQICLYVSEMCSELRHLAKHPRFRTISYLLDMARMESEKLGRELPD